MHHLASAGRCSTFQGWKEPRSARPAERVAEGLGVELVVEARVPAAPAAPVAASPLQLAWRRLRRDRVAVGCLVLLAVIVLAALLSPLIAHALGHAPDTQYPEGLTETGQPRPPSWRFLAGTDDLGRDVLVRAL